jgi:hypothetical protein
MHQLIDCCRNRQFLSKLSQKKKSYVMYRYYHYHIGQFFNIKMSLSTLVKFRPRFTPLIDIILSLA